MTGTWKPPSNRDDADESHQHRTPWRHLRLTWVTDHLAHVLEHIESDETSGIWTGLGYLDHGLPVGSDVDNATLLRLAGQDQLADLIWEAPVDFTAEHGQVCRRDPGHLSGKNEERERLRE